MKKTILTIALVLVLAPAAFSQVNVEYGAELVSRYVWRGFDFYSGDIPNVQPSITFSKSGFAFNVWGSVPVKDRNLNDDELDFTVSYSTTLSPLVSFSGGLIYYTFPSMDNYPDEKSTSPELFASVSISGPFSPSFSVYYDSNLGDGIYFLGSFSKSIIPTVSVVVSAGYMDQYGFTGLSDINFGISKSIPLGAATVTPRAVFTYIPDEQVNPNSTEIWFGLAISR